MGRTLDWLKAYNLRALFAGIARQGGRRFGVTARQVHVDTTSFSVTGEYEADLDAHTLAVTYGYSRDHRADLKQWMLALATTRAGDVPLFGRALDGNASDKGSLVAAVETLAEQLRWRRSPSSCGGDARRAAAVETLAEQLRWRRSPSRSGGDARRAAADAGGGGPALRGR